MHAVLDVYGIARLIVQRVVEAVVKEVVVINVLRPC